MSQTPKKPIRRFLMRFSSGKCPASVNVGMVLQNYLGRWEWQLGSFPMISVVLMHDTTCKTLRCCSPFTPLSRHSGTQSKINWSELNVPLLWFPSLFGLTLTFSKVTWWLNHCRIVTQHIKTNILIVVHHLIGSCSLYIGKTVEVVYLLMIIRA